MARSSIIEAESKIKSFYSEKILPVRMSEDAVPDGLLDQLYSMLTPLVALLVNAHYESKLNEEERQELVDDVLSTMIMRLHRGNLPMDMVAWTQYLKKTIHGLYVDYLRRRSGLRGDQSLSFISFLEDIVVDGVSTTVFIDHGKSPPEILEESEEAEKYKQEILKIIGQISRNNEFLSLLAFYCYRYDLDPEIMPVNSIELNTLQLLTNTLDYYLRVGKPRGVELTI